MGSSRAALVGFAAGCVVVVGALAAEAMAAGLPLRGGLLQLQQDSVLVWVTESLPILLGVAGWTSGSRARDPVALAEPPPVIPVPVARTPRSATTAPPPVPQTLQSANLLGRAGTDARVRALQELVKVLRSQAEGATTENLARSAWLAALGHDVRGPLNAIIGHAETLADEGGARASSDGPVQVASAARRVMDRLGDVFDLAKIEIGQLAVVLEDVDVAQVIEEVRVGAPQASPSATGFGVSLLPGARLVRGDHMRVRQILTTLLGRAFGAAPNGTVTLTAERIGEHAEAWVALRVQDSGAPMSPEEIGAMFTAYVAAGRDPRDVGGLALPVAGRLAQLMGGRIDVVSNSAGTTATLVLPVARTNEALVAPRSTVALNERLAGQSLLVVDAAPSGLAVARYLERAGLVVESVLDIRSARIAARSAERDIVLLDSGLPGAWALVEELVADEVKVVVVSNRDEDVERALEVGVTAFLVQPVERRLVLATLERCLPGT